MKKRSPTIKTVALLVVCFAAGLAARHFWPGAVVPPPSGAVDGQPSPGSEPRSESEGRELALRHCGSCHLAPDPSLLTKRQWIHQIMPQMAVWLGVEPVNLGSQKDGRMLQAAGVFPEGPSISEEEWFEIWSYYRAAAPSEPLPVPDARPILAETPRFQPRKINFNAGAPMISLIHIEGGRIYVGDGYAGILAVMDSRGEVLQRTRVGAGLVDIDSRGGSFYVTLIGRMFPSDVPEGSVVLVAGSGGTPEVVLDELRRPVHLTQADLNGDGREDLLVCSFGNRLGHFAWYEAGADGRYQERVLIEAPGAVRSEVHDFDGDGRPDVAVQMAQAREGIYILFNQGDGNFIPRIVVEQAPTFGNSYFQLVDFDRDGAMDVLSVNGDNGDNPAPHKNYHGIRLYLNDGNAQFHEAWFIPMEGAYKAVPADFDGDGDLDLVAISFFPDWGNEGRDSALYLENQGERFSASRLPEASAGRWMTMDVGDLDGDGDEDVVLGAYSRGPVTIPVPDEVEGHWRRAGAAVLVLENLGHPGK